MQKLPINRENTTGPLIILALSCMMYLSEPSSSEQFAYSRDAIENMELWRLLSGQLLHTNVFHFLLNGAGILLLWGLHGDYYKTGGYLLFVLFSALFIAISLYCFSPHLHSYVGLSGVLHALFTYGAYQDARQGFKSGWWLQLGVALKVLYEQWQGPDESISKLIDANVAIDAHLFGWIAGIVVIVASRIPSPKQNGPSE